MKATRSTTATVLCVWLTVVLQAEVLLKVDITDPSAVKFIATDAPARVDDSSASPFEGVTLLGLFESDSVPVPNIALIGSLSASEGSSPLGSAFNEGMDSRNLNLSQQEGPFDPWLHFWTTSRAFQGVAVADLSRCSFVPVGTTGWIVAGDTTSGSGAVLGSFEVFERVVETPEMAREVLPAVCLSWQSTDRVHYQVQTSPDLDSFPAAGPVLRGTGGELQFLALQMSERHFYRVVVPRSAVLLTVDISDPSAVVFTSTGAPPLVGDSSAWPMDGVTLVGLFEDDSPEIRHVWLTGSLVLPDIDHLNMSVRNGWDGIDTRDLNICEGAGILRPVMNFSTSAPALTGSSTVDLSMASFVPPGSTGVITVGSGERGSNAVLGNYQVIGGSVEAPQVEIETLQATRLTWPSEDGRQYQVQVSPDGVSWANTGPMMDGTGGELEFLESQSPERRFYRLVAAYGLEILEATWGHDGVFRDVRAYIEARIVDNTVSIHVSDPSFGGTGSLFADDTLYVRYRNASGEYEAVVEEMNLEMLVIPDPDHTKIN